MASSPKPDYETVSFTRWRWLTYMSMFVGWSSFYFCRRSLASSIMNLIQDNGFSTDDIGMIISSFAVAYAISKFVCALLSDHVSSKRMFSFGLVLTGACCVVFPLSKNVTVSSAIWFIEGLLQGLGWAPCAVLLKKWFPPSQMGRWWSVLSSSGNIAGAVSPFLFTSLSTVWNWKFNFYLFGTATVFVGVSVLFTMKDSPSDIGGITSFSSVNGKEENSQEKGTRVEPTRKWYEVFLLRDLWIASAIYAMLYLIKNGNLNWSQLYFIQVAGRSETTAAAIVGMLQVGGIAGNMVMGYISDLFLTAKTEKTKCPRAPVLFGISLVMVFALHLLVSTVTESSSEVWLSMLMLMVGFLVDGGIATVGLVSMEIVPSVLAGSAHGLACAVAQAGAFAAGWPFAYAIENYSWSAAYRLLELVSLSMVVLCCYLLLLLLRGLAQARRKVE